MAQERVILLATVHGEMGKAAHRVSALEGEFVAARWAPNLAANATAAKW
jgi:hypothetical protein